MSQDVSMSASEAATPTDEAPRTESVSKQTQGDGAGHDLKGKGKAREIEPDKDAEATPEELQRQLEILRKELESNLQKKQSIDRALASHEASIYAFETSYLSADLSGGPGNNTAFGNIVKGYDSYLKTSSGGGAPGNDAARKKGGSSTRGLGALGAGGFGGLGGMLGAVEESDRIFSRSSLTYETSLQLRDRDAGVVTASEGEGDEDLNEDGEEANTSTTNKDASVAAPANSLKESHSRPDSAGSSQPKDPKRTKRK